MWILLPFILWSNVRIFVTCNQLYTATEGIHGSHFVVDLLNANVVMT